jgi:hypothetical protein
MIVASAQWTASGEEVVNTEELPIEINDVWKRATRVNVLSPFSCQSKN